MTASAIFIDANARCAITTEVLPDGDVIWIATDLELDGCIGQGPNSGEAIADLFAAREEYQAALSDEPPGSSASTDEPSDNRPMPMPAETVFLTPEPAAA
jgi:hypothetical protein